MRVTFPYHLVTRIARDIRRFLFDEKLERSPVPRNRGAPERGQHSQEQADCVVQLLAAASVPGPKGIAMSDPAEWLKRL